MRINKNEQMLIHEPEFILNCNASFKHETIVIKPEMVTCKISIFFHFILLEFVKYLEFYHSYK